MYKKDTTPFLRPDEEILMMIHRHWIIFVFKSLYIAALVLSTSIILWFKTDLIYIVGDMVFWGSLSIFWMMFLTFIYLSWISDELDLFVITNVRIIGIEQESSLSRTISECSLDRVQEVNAQISGVLQTIFTYGKIHIHTASENSDLIVSYAPAPMDNARKINNVIQEYRTSHGIIPAKEEIKSGI